MRTGHARGGSTRDLSRGQFPPGGNAAEPAAYPPLIVIAGATATGKTGLSLDLAESIPGAEIISADSRQVYLGLDIGTAKVPLGERRGIPHHGLDLVDPDQPFSVADFTRHADDALRGIAQRGGVAILVGGTGLYLRAVARGLALDQVPSDAALRANLELEFEAEGLAPLVERLRRLAPNLAATTDLHNARRVVRALEIAELQGDRPRPQARGYPGPSIWLGLTVDPPTHREWIANRARAQFDDGLVEEAAAVRARGYPDGLRSLSAIGYPEAFAVLDGGMTREQAIAEDARRNVAFAKRQRTWFRREPDVAWFDATSTNPLPWARAAIKEFSADAGVSRAR
jgi:tRNA dimethylallyltransferase